MFTWSLDFEILQGHPKNAPSISTSYQALEEILEAVQNNSRKAEIGMYWRLIWQCQKKKALRFRRVSQALMSTVGVGWWGVIVVTVEASGISQN